MVEKRAYTQADFGLGVTIPELIDGDDLEIRSQSLKGGKNMRVTRGRTLRSRPGLELKVGVAADQTLHDMRVQEGTSEQRYAVVIEDNGLQVWDDQYRVVAFLTDMPWGNFPNGRPWVTQFDNVMIFGGYGFWALEFKDGAWTFGELSFSDLPGGEKALPFWAFERGVTLTPSAYTGNITVTASSPIFSSAWVGKRLRYARKEMTVTGVLSSTQIQAAVAQELPPTFRLVFASATAMSGYAVGQVVVASTTNWSGVIVEIDGTTMYCVTILRDAAQEGAAAGSGTTAIFGGPVAADDEIVGPNSAVKPNTVTRETVPKGTFIWDEQLWSDHRGWPQSGTEVNGRLALCNFAQVPNLICMSSSRGFSDFGMGSGDDDAILRTAGNRNPRFLHIVNSVDLLIFADRGCYYVKTRDGELVTPSNFQVTQFDERGSDLVQPVAVEGGVLFVERNKGTIGACVLSGNVYLNWTVLDLTRFHAHLIDAPVAICGPAADPSMSERYVIVTNGDGSMAAMSWFTTFGEERVGFFPWQTAAGVVRRVFTLFDGYHAIVERSAYQPDLLPWVPPPANVAATDMVVDFDVVGMGSVYTLNDATGETVPGGIRITATGSNPFIERDPATAPFAGSAFRYVVVHGKVISGGRQFRAFYKTASTTNWTTARSMRPINFTEIFAQTGEYKFFAVFDAADSEAYATTWAAENVTALRLDIMSTNESIHEIYSIRVVSSLGGNYTLERFNPDFLLDSAIETAGPLNAQALATDGGLQITTDAGTPIIGQGAAMARLGGQTVKVWENRETLATAELGASGEFATEPDIEALAQVGLPIDVRAEPWPREFLESPRRGMIKARVIRAAVAVRDTVSFGFRRNNTTTITPARRQSDSATEAPPLKTDWYRFNIFGNRAHPEMEIFAPEPNTLEITSITQEVQG